MDWLPKANDRRVRSLRARPVDLTGGWPVTTAAGAVVLAVLVLHATLALFCLIATAALPLRHHRQDARRRSNDKAD